MKLAKLPVFIIILIMLASCTKAPDEQPIDESQEPAVSEPAPAIIPQTARKTPGAVRELTEKWAELSVYDGQDTNAPVTRAELAAVINRFFAYDTPNQAIYLDVSPGDKHFSDVQAISAAGIMAPDGESFNPDEAISRQDAAVILADAFCGVLPEPDTDVFQDYADIAPSALNAASYLGKRGWVGGYEFSPNNSLKWGELLRILDAMFNDIITGEDPELSGIYPAGIAVFSDSVTIKNAYITGDIFISPEVGQVEIISSVINGNIYIGRGGGSGSLPTAAIIDSQVGEVYCEKSAAIKLGAAVDMMYINYSSSIKLGEDAVIEGLLVAKAAEISGNGRIEKAVIRADAIGTSFETMPREYIDAPNCAYVGQATGFIKLFSDTYYISGGARLTMGFADIGGSTYYFNADGVMTTGHAIIDLEGYYFGKDGAMYTGWLEEDGNESYYDESGVRAFGLTEINGSGYIFTSGGIMQTGMIDYEGQRYYAAEDGKLCSGLFSYGDGTYFAQSGVLQSGIIEIGEGLYFFDDESYMMLKNTEIDGYNIDENGLLTPKETVISSGNAELDILLDAVIAEITDESMSLDDKMYAVYKWTADNIRYRATPIDLSNGFTQELVAEHGLNTLNTRRGACEHFAIINALLFNRLGIETILIEGYRYSTYYYTWDEHSWVLGKIDDKWYHFDTLYELQHTGVVRSVFMKTDSEMESHHRWETDDYPVCDGSTEY